MFSLGQARQGLADQYLQALEGDITFDRYMDLQEFLEGLLARKVDLVTLTAIRAPLKPEIEREVVYVT